MALSLLVGKDVLHLILKELDIPLHLYLSEFVPMMFTLRLLQQPEVLLSHCAGVLGQSTNIGLHLLNPIK